ncbi:MAG TPA: flagellar type III secretion system pore protein FliP [Myxococcales bacterium]|nr:flagellar type III secretion system pore protein FliP [Myxococcales bacterium]
MILADPALSLQVGAGGSAAVKLFLLITALSFASALAVSLTSFTRIVIVLSFARQGLGAAQLPPNQVLIGLALILSGFVMAPTARRIHTEALGPYLDDKLAPAEAFERAAAPLREFMLRQTRTEDLKLFYEASGLPRPSRSEEVPLTVAAPAFMVSELTTAFRMGLFVLVPLLVIDLLVATILMSLGMMMVPPTLISLPLKLAVFLLADGWHLLVSALLRSFA